MSSRGFGCGAPFEYSRDGVNFTPMLVVSPTAPGAPLQSYAFTEPVYGTLFVRALDTDRSQGNNSPDTLFIDEMFVVTSFTAVDTTPPAAPSGLVATAGSGGVALDWTDNTEPDLAGYSVYRADTSGGAYARPTPAPITISAYTDSAVTNGQTYFYVVTASDTNDNESLFSGEESATPQSSGTATTMHVSAILPGTANAARGAKFGQATVAVVDNLGNPVAGAVVTGSFTGDYGETRSGTTGGGGTAVLTTAASTKKPSITFCVDSISVGGLSYDQAANAATCASF